MKKDMVLELIALIDPLYGSLVKDVCTDLDIDKLRLSGLIDRAQERGYVMSIRNGPCKSGRIVTLEDVTARKALHAANEYVDRWECGL